MPLFSTSDTIQPSVEVSAPKYSNSQILKFLGYNQDGSQNVWGKVTSWLPGFGIEQNLAAQHLTKGTDANGLIQKDMANNLDKFKTAALIAATVASGGATGAAAGAGGAAAADAATDTAGAQAATGAAQSGGNALVKNVLGGGGGNTGGIVSSVLNPLSKDFNSASDTNDYYANLKKQRTYSYGANNYVL